MKHRLAVILCCTAALPAFANDYLDYRQDRTRQNLSEYHRDFNEADVELPPVPNPDAEGWFELYIGNTFAGHPRILLDSITYAPDGSVRYLFNNHSAKGMDNVTAEGIYCVSGKKLLDSEGSLLKTFAYADLANNRWIMPRNAGWQTLGSQRNSSDRVRRVLYDAFCIDGKAKDDADLRRRVTKQGRTGEREYGK